AQNASPSSPHLTDEQDRMMTGQLNPAAERTSRANALYAEALSAGPQSDPREILEKLREVIALDPHFAAAQVQSANLLLQSGQIETALDQLQAARTANPDSAAIEAALGYAQRLHGDNGEAFRLSQEALTRDTDQAVAMRVLLEIAAEQNDLAGGVIHVEDILKQKGADVPGSAWLTLAKLYIEVARSDPPSRTGDAILKTLLPIYQQAAAKPPLSVETLTLLSDTYHDLGQKREALKILQQATSLEPSNVDTILRCADLEADLDQKTEALKDYEQAYALNPGLTGLRETLVRLYLENKHFDDASTLLQEALTESPHDPALKVDLGIAYEGAGQHEKAEACFQQAFASSACTDDVYLKLVLFHLGRKELKKAGQILTTAEARFPASAKVRFYEAIEHRYKKEYNEALAYLAQMRLLVPGSDANSLDISYYLENALNLNLAGRQDQIEPVLREGITKYPTNPDLMNELAYFWADRGDHLAEALVLSKHALALAPDSGPVQDTCGWVYFKMGQTKNALPYLQQAAVLTDNDPVILQHIGDTYLKLDRTREAIATWRLALKKDPGNHDLTNRIDAALAQANNAHSRSAPNK
ncbi:MAG TPA: tetratricopeptide repeat protein, partial [Candidatus Methylacidiphilales bacterium]